MAKKEIHNAIVTRNTDEDAGVNLRGGVFFNAPTLFEGEYPEAAFPCFQFVSQGGAGIFFVPKVGDELEIEILVDDGTDDTSDVELSEPRFKCMVFDQDNDLNELFKTNYPFRMGWISNSGHYLLFDDKKGSEFASLVSKGGHIVRLSDAKGAVALMVKTTAGHTLLLNDTANTVNLTHKDGGSVDITDSKVEVKEATGTNRVILEAGKATIESDALVHIKAPAVEVGDPATFSATIAENIVSAHDIHQHPPIPPLVGGPVLPPLISLASLSGTPLDPVALDILIKGNV